MPPNTVKVGRSGKWGNPFKEGEHGTREECVTLFAAMLRGEFCLTTDNLAEQQAYHAMAHRGCDRIEGLEPGLLVQAWHALSRRCVAVLRPPIGSRPKRHE